jgi:hypothetical protein
MLSDVAGEDILLSIDMHFVLEETVKSIVFNQVLPNIVKSFRDYF